MAGRSRLWRGNYGGRFELLPGQALAAAVAVGLKFPLYAAPALGTDGKKSPAEVGGDHAHLHDRHGHAERERILLNAQKTVGRLVKAEADLFKDVERRA